MKIIFLILLLISLSFQDYPVHCLYENIRGTWYFKNTAQYYNSKVALERCHIDSPVIPVEYIKMELLYPNIVKDNKGGEGTWTLVYDQGMEVRIDNKIYRAYFNFTQDGEKVISHCEKTFTGIFHDNVPNSGKWGCFQAIRVLENEKSHKNEYYLSDFFPKSPKKLNDEKYKNNKEFIEKLNAVQKNWIAGEYSFWETKKIPEIQNLMGKPMSSMRSAAHLKHMQFMRATKKNSSKKRDFPENFSWRNKDGKNYVSPVRNQLKCGSCYAFAALGNAEANVRITSELQDTTIFSTQEIVDCSCSIYAQGCSGGFPILIFKYGYDIGFVQETCYPYQGNETKQCIKKECSSFKRYVADYGYIGEYYGGCSEELMMDKIYENGPVSVGFMIYSDLRNYKSGVYHHVASLEDEINDPKFIPTNHAVVVTGWGVENGEKYWEVKNSWDEKWGNKGYFLIRRGVDECGIESETSWLKI